MTKVRLGLLLLVAVSIGLFLTTSVRAEPPGGEGEGEKTSIAPFAAIKHVKHRAFPPDDVGVLPGRERNV